MSTAPVAECTADDETDYVNVKDGTGRPNNNINMSLQDTRMPSYYTGSWIWKADVPLLYLPPYLRPVSKRPFYTKRSLTAKHELQIQSLLPQTNLLFYCSGIPTYIQGVPGRKDLTSGRVFLRSNYTDITQNTYIQRLYIYIYKHTHTHAGAHLRSTRRSNLQLLEDGQENVQTGLRKVSRFVW